MAFKFRDHVTKDAYESFLEAGGSMASGTKPKKPSLEVGVIDNRRQYVDYKRNKNGADHIKNPLKKVDEDQLDLLTSLYTQRAKDINARRSRPGVKQVM